MVMEIGTPENPEALTPREVVDREVANITSAEYGLNMREVLMHNRGNKYVRCRARIIRHLRMKGWSFPKIGHYLNDRDHSTIMHSLERYITDVERERWENYKSMVANNRGGAVGVRSDHEDVRKPDTP